MVVLDRPRSLSGCKSVWVQMRIPEDIAIASVDGTVDWRILVVGATLEV